METNIKILKKSNSILPINRTVIAGYHKYPAMTVILLFFVFSFAGWVWETFFVYFQIGELVNRGVLHGPWLPIYGTGGVLFILLMNRLRNNPLIVFILGMAVCGIVEYSTSWFLETFLHASWWDYSSSPVNLNGRICLEGLLFFGAAGCIMLYFCAPVFNKLLLNTPRKVKAVICVCLIALFALDLIYSKGNPNMGLGITQ